MKIFAVDLILTNLISNKAEEKGTLKRVFFSLGQI